MARGLRPLELIACAAPAYLKAKGTPRQPSDLSKHDCLGFAGSAIEERWEFSRKDGKVAVFVKSRFSANSGQALKQAALAGLGILFQAAELTQEDFKVRQTGSSAAQVAVDPADASPVRPGP